MFFHTSSDTSFKSLDTEIMRSLYTLVKRISKITNSIILLLRITIYSWKILIANLLILAYIDFC